MATVVAEMSALDVAHVIIEQSEIDMLVKTAPGALAEIAQQPWYERLLIEADPYRFPQQHAGLLQAFGPAINLANVAPGQVLRLEGLRRGIGRAVDYSLLA
jgi:phosphosulfolactate synthase